MAYNRQPQTVLAGVALKQNPPPSVVAPAGIVPVTLDADIATTTSLGVVQVGSGLSITPGGVLSASGGDSGCFVNVVMTSTNYTATVADCYIGVTNSDEERSITLTLPLGNIGKLYYIKNQGTGNIKIQGTSGQTIDGSSSKTLGTNGSFIVVFAGNRWNIL
ncbi:hypothetical protein UFOVP71_322 [uncultured Caudovirales phage]|uniref:Uncharacterized protein n=1 Tax=uncultured Caudovirales phage TaxID=2100421 RepID=A0A6J5TBU7_9CAUD|nr:hypothetical protein UFOVP71_322 [uncultured Caudovirales phage]